MVVLTRAGGSSKTARYIPVCLEPSPYQDGRARVRTNQSLSVFSRHVILRNLLRVDFTFLIGICVFDTCYDVSLERISLFEQLVDAFRISALNVPESLQVSRLCTRTGSCCLPLECRILSSTRRASLRGTGPAFFLRSHFFPGFFLGGRPPLVTFLAGARLGFGTFLPFFLVAIPAV